ncbi:MAG: dimethyl sulfoxide reductase anchor subunit, partial [Actinomycetota bacterium]|nr:dimethyl sulfoxide reductase anchor subunit [Actinomycetota bacterium]
RRFNLSMACNHCVEPTCLSGCPTNAYVKLENGIVAHHADDCIGCQYCIWNCPYEVPVFNPHRRVVTKCDLCQPRLAAGGAPACVEACPTEAIKVEKVNVAAWRLDHHQADAPGLPPSAITLSTTRIIIPESMPAQTRSVVDERLDPADPHWPLVAVTLLTQLSLGALMATVALQILAPGRPGIGGAAAAAGAGAVALAVSVLHLGRPAVAWKALRNLRRSWLSREVALFGAFSIATFSYAVATLLEVGGQESLLAFGIVAVTLGVAGVYASGRLYLVPARPVWDSGRTLVAFFATAVATGPLVAALAIRPATAGARLLFALAAAGCVLQLGATQHLVASIAVRREREFALSARLLFGRFRMLFALRVACALVAAAACSGAAIFVDPAAASPLALVVGAVVGAGELIGRYLFFVTVTPMTAARRFSAGSR